MRRVVAAAMGLVSSVWSIGLLAAFGGVGHPIRVAHADDLAEKAFFTIVVDGEAAPAEMTEMIVTCPPGAVAVSGGLDVVELEDSVFFRTYTSAPMIDGVPITHVEDGTYPTSSAWRLRVKNTKDGPVAYRAAAVCTVIEGAETVVRTRTETRRKERTALCPSRVTWGGGFDSVDEHFVYENAFLFSSEYLSLSNLLPGRRWRSGSAWRVEAIESASEEMPLKVAASCTPNWPNLTVMGALTRTLNLDGGIQRHSVQCREDEAAVGQAVQTFMSLASFMTSSPTFGERGIRLGEMAPGRAPAPRGAQSVTEAFHDFRVETNLAAMCVDVHPNVFLPMVLSLW